MIKYTIKRQDALDALELNDLVAGNWITDVYLALDSEARSRAEKPGCSGCLVGNTLNRALPINLSYYDVCRIAKEVTFDCGGLTNKRNTAFHLKTKNYLAALSCQFEGRIRETAISHSLVQLTKLTPAKRKTLETWIRKNIPKEFEIEVGGD